MPDTTVPPVKGSTPDQKPAPSWETMEAAEMRQVLLECFNKGIKQAVAQDQSRLQRERDQEAR